MGRAGVGSRGFHSKEEEALWKVLSRKGCDLLCILKAHPSCSVEEWVVKRPVLQGDSEMPLLQSRHGGGG